jgi:predicted permease
MKKALIITFSLVLLAMLVVTTWASTHENVFSAGGRMMAEPWFVATLFDTYFAFLTFYVWVLFKERSAFKKAIWFVLIMALGNIAMAVYILLEIRRLKHNFTAQRLLTEAKPA